LLNNSETVKVTKNLKESKNVCIEPLNSFLEVSQSVNAATIQGVHKSCSDSDFFTTLYAIFQIEFFALHHWKEELKTLNLSGSTFLNPQK